MGWSRRAHFTHSLLAQVQYCRCDLYAPLWQACRAFAAVRLVVIAHGSHVMHFAGHAARVADVHSMANRKCVNLLVQSRFRSPFPARFCFGSSAHVEPMGAQRVLLSMYILLMESAGVCPNGFPCIELAAGGVELELSAWCGSHAKRRSWQRGASVR